MYYCNSLSWCLWNIFYTFKASDELDAKVKFTRVSDKIFKYLKVFHGIPVMFQKDDCVSCCEIEAQASDTRGKEHD